VATTEAEATVEIQSGDPNEAGYRPFRLGEFKFRRDDYFVYIDWPTGSHVMSADAFLKALQRDVAWDFFYGIVNFDGVIGTVNHYGTVDLFAGRYNDSYRKAELDHLENFETPLIRETFKAMLDDWTNDGFDPFASPSETGTAFGPKNGDNRRAITRHRLPTMRRPSRSQPRSTMTCMSAITPAASSATNASRRAVWTPRIPTRLRWPAEGSTPGSRPSPTARFPIPRASTAATASACARRARSCSSPSTTCARPARGTNPSRP